MRCTLDQFDVIVYRGMIHVIPSKYIRLLTVKHKITIFLFHSIKSCMKGNIYSLHLMYLDIGWEHCLHCAPPTTCMDIQRGLKMKYLCHGMNTCVCSP